MAFATSLRTKSRLIRSLFPPWNGTYLVMLLAQIGILRTEAPHLTRYPSGKTGKKCVALEHIINDRDEELVRDQRFQGLLVDFGPESPLARVLSPRLPTQHPQPYAPLARI